MLLGQIDFTMLRQICRRGRLMAFMRDSSSTATSAVASSITSAIQTLIQNVLPPKSMEDSNSMLPLEVYDEIRSILNAELPSMQFRHFKDFPHPDPAHVLPRQATPVQHIKIKSRDYSTFKQHQGNSSIGYYSSASGETEISAGFIDTIWRQTLDGVAQTFLVVFRHQFLSSEDNQRNPYQARNGFQVEIAYTSPPNVHRVVIRPNQVIGHMAYYEMPPGTFGIKRGITILINSLHRNRE